MKKRTICIFVLVVALLFSGCVQQSPDRSIQTGTANPNVGEAAPAQPSEESASDSGGTVTAADTSEMFTDRDQNTEYDENSSAWIELTGDSASCSSDAVQISGSTVTITDEGTYILTGTLNDGMIIVNAGEDDKPHLIFNGISVSSSTSAPIYILEADKVVVTLADGTTNTLSNGGTFTAIDENDIDAAVFSKQDLTFNGSGSLAVESPAGHGIVGKDDLVFTGGAYTVESASHGIEANDSIRITGAQFSIASGKDGLHAENTDDASLGFVYIESGDFDIDAEGDGISAGAYMQIEDGDFDIVTGGGSENAEQQTSEFWGGFGGGRGGHSKEHGQPVAAVESAETEDSSTSIKGIKATGTLLINSGNFLINSADDAVHSNASATVNGGTFEIASGDDAFHSDETLIITSGTITISESYEGLEGLHVNVTGGDITLIASDDGLNAAGGTDQSGFGGHRGNDMFGGKGGMGGGSGSSSSGSIRISGGNLSVSANGDGLDANGTLEITGGTISVSGPTSGDTAVLDYDVSAVIKGGTFIGTGAVQMAQTFGDSEQGVISLNAGNQSAGTLIAVTDRNGNTLFSYEPEQPFSIVIFSSPDIVKGESYTVSIGSQSEEFSAV